MIAIAFCERLRTVFVRQVYAVFRGQSGKPRSHIVPLRVPVEAEAFPPLLCDFERLAPVLQFESRIPGFTGGWFS